MKPTSLCQKPGKNIKNLENSIDNDTSFIIVKDIRNLMNNEKLKNNENFQLSLSFYNMEANLMHKEHNIKSLNHINETIRNDKENTQNERISKRFIIDNQSNNSKQSPMRNNLKKNMNSSPYSQKSFFTIKNSGKFEQKTSEITHIRNKLIKQFMLEKPKLNKVTSQTSLQKIYGINPKEKKPIVLSKSPTQEKNNFYYKQQPYLFPSMINMGVISNKLPKIH